MSNPDILATTLIDEGDRVRLVFNPKPINRAAVLAIGVAFAVVVVVAIAVRQPDTIWVAIPVVAVGAAIVLASLILDPTKRGVAVSTVFDLASRRIRVERTEPGQEPVVDADIGFDEVQEISVVRIASKGTVTEVMRLVVPGRTSILLSEDLQGSTIARRNIDRLRPLADLIAARTGLPRGPEPGLLQEVTGAVFGVTRS